MSSSSSASFSSDSAGWTTWSTDGTVAFGAEFDVAVIGSGLAGLSAAHRVLRSAPNARVAIFESDQQIGGRVRSHDMAKVDPRLGTDAVASIGGTMVMLDNRSLLGLAQEHDFLPFQPNLQVNFSSVHLENLALAPFLLLRLWLLGREINIKIRKPVEEPNWAQLKHITRLDKVPLDEWLKENSKEFGKEVGARCRAAVQDWMFQLENYPSDLSLLSTFFAADIVYLRLTNVQPTGVVVPRLLRWDEGTGVLVKKVVKSLRDRGAQVYYKHRAVSFQQKSKHVNVTLATPRINSDGSLNYDKPQSTITIRAKRVVIATAPNVAARLDYSPKLPDVHRKLGSMIQVWDDPAVQVMMTSPQRFWEPQPGGIFALPPPASPKKVSGVYGPVFELSERDPRYSHSEPSYGIVRILVQASRIQKGSRLWSDDKIAESATAYLNQQWFDSKQPHSGFEQARFWHFNYEDTPDIKDVTFYFKRSKTLDYARNLRHFRDPHGKIFFAGSERADRGLHWMEGAVRSGNLAAAAVLADTQSSFNAKTFWADIKNSKDAALHQLRREEDLKVEITNAFQLLARFFKWVMKHVVDELDLAFDVSLDGFSNSEPKLALESACEGKYAFVCKAQKRVYDAFKEAVVEEVQAFAQKVHGSHSAYDRPTRGHCCAIA